MASFSPDGSQLAYVTRLAEDRPFKRYRGGYSSDVYVYDLRSNTAINITDSNAIDAKPIWIGDKIFFLSDQDDNMRLNIWAYDIEEGSSSQITEFENFDISYLGGSEDELVFEAGGELYRLDVASESAEVVEVEVVSDLAAELPRAVDVSRRINAMAASPEGKRVVFEARGELFNVPAEEGFTINLTQSSGAFDHSPAWSPDGQWIAYWSDRSGEYEIHLQAPDGNSVGRQLTQRGAGFGYRLFWSPDSSKLSFIDETNTVYVIDVESGDVQEAGNTLWNLGHGSRYGYTIAWSPDSRWLAFEQGMANTRSALFIYDTQEQQSHQITSGFYNDQRPVFGVEGKYLFFLTDRSMDAVYSDLDQTWVYPNATRLAAISLQPDAPSLLPIGNDEMSQPEAEEEANSEEESEEEDIAIAIDFDDMEARLQLLPPDAGNFGRLFSFEGKIAYIRSPNTGSADDDAKLVFYDIEDEEEKTILTDVNGAVQTADGSALLVRSNNRYGIVEANPDQRIEDAVPTDGLVMQLVPREEWQQIFDDTWRRYRDFFYDPNMQRSGLGCLIRTIWCIANRCQNSLGCAKYSIPFVRGNQRRSYLCKARRCGAG